MTKTYESRRDADETRETREARCLDRLLPERERARRVAVTGEALNRLAEYRAYLDALAESSDDPACSGREQLADRAFDAERSYRVLLAEGLRTINDLRDAGMLHSAIGEFGRRAGKDGDLEGLLADAKRELERAFPDAASHPFDEALPALQRRKIELHNDPQAGTIGIRAPSLTDGSRAGAQVRLAPRPGDLGRVSLDDFFGAGGRAGVHGHTPVALAPDCHHRPSIAVSDRLTVDAYSALVGGLAAGRESMYRHARKVSVYGHGRPAVEARDPVSIIVGVIIAVGVALIIYGAVTGNAGVAGFGAVLVIGGLLVLFGGYVLIIGVAA
jgi:hypothetical protein